MTAKGERIRGDFIGWVFGQRDLGQVERRFGGVRVFQSVYGEGGREFWAIRSE